MESIIKIEALNRALQSINEKSIDFSLLKSIKDFMDIDLNDFSQELLLGTERDYYTQQINLFCEMILENYNQNIEKLEKFDADEFLDKFLYIDEKIYEKELDKIKPLSKTYKEYHTSYEHKSFTNYVSDVELNRLENDMYNAKEEYDNQKQVVNDLYELKENNFKENEFILSVDFEEMINKVYELQKIVENIVIPVSPTIERAFNNQEALFVAYNVFVKLELIEDVHSRIFIDEFDNTSPLVSESIHKKPKVDMYIMYAINKLLPFILEGKKIAWENKMLESFNIKKSTYDKKKNVDDFYKKPFHKMIDSEFNKLE